VTDAEPTAGTASGSPSAVARRSGRQPVSSRAEIEHAAFRLFDERGFDMTTVDDIAVAAGIARRTFFSYFASKNDVPWGSFDHELDHLRGVLAAFGDDVPVMEAIRLAVLDFNTVARAEQPWHRRRLALILSTPALQAHSTIRYTAWRQVINEFVARRLCVSQGSLIVQTIGYTSLGAAVASYEVWLGEDEADLLDLLDTAFRNLAVGFAAATQTAPVGVDGISIQELDG
jgi:TetR/AcrR family transcriptional regulator, regulator of mycofactocin system